MASAGCKLHAAGLCGGSNLGLHAGAMSAILPAGLISQSSAQNSLAFPASSSSCSRGFSGPTLRCCSAGSRRALRSRVFCVAAPTQVEEELLESEEASEEDKLVIPTYAEIENLLKVVCDETKVAELGVKIGSFNLHVRRNVAAPAVATPPAPPASAPVKPSSTPSPSPSPSPSKLAAKPGPKVSPLMTKSVMYHELQNAAAENGVVFVNAPKVGLFRQGKFVKGKFGPPLCLEGQAVKEGQIVCYLEQFGTQLPVQADTSGDVVKILWEDGVPVGYGDPLIALKPKKV